MHHINGITLMKLKLSGITLMVNCGLILKIIFKRSINIIKTYRDLLTQQYPALCQLSESYSSWMVRASHWSSQGCRFNCRLSTVKKVSEFAQCVMCGLHIVRTHVYIRPISRFYPQRPNHHPFNLFSLGSPVKAISSGPSVMRNKPTVFGVQVKWTGQHFHSVHAK